jgi:hypothetical protein
MSMSNVDVKCRCRMSMSNVDVECRCRMLMSNVDVNIFVCSKFVDALFVVIVLLLDVPTQAALINANATAACLKLICYFDGVLFLLKILNCCSDKSECHRRCYKKQIVVSKVLPIQSNF